MLCSENFDYIGELIIIMIGLGVRLDNWIKLARAITIAAFAVVR